MPYSTRCFFIEQGPPSFCDRKNTVIHKVEHLGITWWLTLSAKRPMPFQILMNFEFGPTDESRALRHNPQMKIKVVSKVQYVNETFEKTQMDSFCDFKTQYGLPDLCPPEVPFGNFICWKLPSIRYYVEITGVFPIFRKERIETRNFLTKTENSDVVLVVGDKRFHVSKNTLSENASYFDTMFSGKFSESNKEEIKFESVNPRIFQCLLNLLYGNDALDDENVEKVLEMAHMMLATFVLQKCQDFLCHHSYLPDYRKMALAKKYDFKELEDVCNKVKDGSLSFVNRGKEVVLRGNAWPNSKHEYSHALVNFRPGEPDYWSLPKKWIPRSRNFF